MEKEDSTEEEPVGSLAPKNMKDVYTSEGEDHFIDATTTSELPDDEMVGTTVDANIERLEKAHEIHEVQDIESPATKHLLNNELNETAADGLELSSGIRRVDQEIHTYQKHLVDNEVEDTTGMEIRSHEEDDKAHSSTFSSPVRLLNSENSVSTVTGEPDIQDDQKEDNSIDDTALNSTATDMEIRGQEEDGSTHSSSSSLVRLSNSGNLINTLTGEPDLQKEHQDKDNSIDDSVPISTATDMEIRSHEVDGFTHSSTSSSPVRLSNSENWTNTQSGEPDLQKEHQDKDNFIDDSAPHSTATDMELRGHGEDGSSHSSTSSSPVRLSNSENSISTQTGEPDIQKEHQEKDNSIADSALNPTATDIEIRDEEEDNSTDNCGTASTIRLSNSENSIDILTGELDFQKEDQWKDVERGSEMIAVNHQSAENMETEIHHVQEESEDEDSMQMKSKDVSTATSIEDGEKVGDDLNDRQGITENSFSEETGDMKTDAKNNNSSKEEGSVINGTREAEVESNSVAWPQRAAALTNFVKVKSLVAVSNIFRRLSGRTDENYDSYEKDKDINSKNKSMEEVTSSEKECQEGSQTTVEKPGWRSLSLLRFSFDKNQANRAALNEAALEAIAMKGRIVLYTRLWCQYCKEARLFLRKRRLRYSEINIDVYPSRKLELEKITGSSDVPVVFFNHVLIGGLDELKALDESGKLEEKIEYITAEGPSPKAPLPPFSGEDDVSSRGVVDELALIVRKMKESVVVKDRFYKFRRVTNCFLGSEAINFLSEDQYLERHEAIEFARKLSKELFFHHVLDENTFEDGNHLYRFMDQDPVITRCQNIPRGIMQRKRQTLVELSHRLRYLLYAIIDAYTSEDGTHVDYRTIHGSEEFARFLRIAEELQRVDLNRTAKEERLAFFINLYNLMTIHAILVWGHPEGALDRRRLLNDFKYVIGGCAYSLSDIQNGILRANQRPPYALYRPFGITDKRFKVSLPYTEPLIHFALVFGNRSSPALRCYSPKNIDVELSEAARNFLQNGAFILHLDSMTVSVTSILKWYSVDFGRTEVEVLKHAANYLEVEKTQTLLELLDSTQLKVVYQPYDWRLNS